MPYQLFEFGAGENHTVFGQLLSGADVLEALAAVECGANDKPVNDAVIETIEITE